MVTSGVSGDCKHGVNKKVVGSARTNRGERSVSVGLAHRVAERASRCPTVHHLDLPGRTLPL